jgi:hypothetical protein
MSTKRRIIVPLFIIAVTSLTSPAHAGQHDVITPGECEDAGGKVEPLGGGRGRCVGGDLAGHLVAGVK